MELKLSAITEANSSSVIQVADSIFAKEFNPGLIHQVVQACRAGLRSGTRAQKSRSEVSGGGAKPWRQKGTGRARAGTNRSPIWRGGGVTFAAKQRDFSQKINKKMYLRAMRSILAELVKHDRLILVESFEVATPRTSDLVKKLDILSLRNVLIVVDDIDFNLYLAARNLETVDVCEISGINPINLIDFEKVLFTLPALKRVEERLA